MDVPREKVMQVNRMMGPGKIEETDAAVVGAGLEHVVADGFNEKGGNRLARAHHSHQENSDGKAQSERSEKS